MTEVVRLEGGSMTHEVRVGDTVRSRRDPLSALVASAYPRKLLAHRRRSTEGQRMPFLVVGEHGIERCLDRVGQPSLISAVRLERRVDQRT